MPDVTQGKMTPLVVPRDGLFTRMSNAVRYVIDGVSPATWFGPNQPLVPMATPDTKGRAWDYQTGYNLNYNPRGNEAVGFQDLRNLAANCDILRMVIETRKDQMENLEWDIRPKLDPVTGDPVTQAGQPERIAMIKNFFRKPDMRNRFNQWQRAILEDMLVLDAATVWKHRTNGGQLLSLDLIDGSTIMPLIDASGRAPLGNSPAYQQILHGIPAADFSFEELLYAPRNVTTNKVYGYGPVEQIIITANISIRRTLFQLDYYREGSLPDAVIGLPKEFTIEQIAGFQTYFDSMLSGNFAQRRKLRAVPGDFKYQEIKQPPLKDMYDEWLARLICYCFSIPPEPFVQITNRSVGETQERRSQEEGLEPLMKWFADCIMNPVIEEDFASPDLEFAYVEQQDVDPKIQGEINERYVRAGIISIDSAREDIGEAPLGGVFSQPMVLTATGYVPVDPQEAAELSASKNPVQALGPDGLPLDPEEDEDVDTIEDKGNKDAEAKDAETEDEITEKLVKRHGLSKKKVSIAPAPSRPAAIKARRSMAERFTKLFHAMFPQIEALVRAELAKVTPEEDAQAKSIHGYARADILPLSKAKTPGKRIADKLDLSALTVVAAQSVDDIARVAADSSKTTLAKMGVEVDSDLVDQINARAVTFARNRAAELVGKKILKNGDIVENPRAKYRIDQGTRDEVRTTVNTGLAEGWGVDGIIDALEENGAFSAQRADLIARTEIGNANSQGALEGYKEAEELGLNVQKIWITDTDPCPVCIENGDAGPIDLGDTFPSGDDAPLAHPNCECVLASVVEGEE